MHSPVTFVNPLAVGQIYCKEATANENGVLSVAEVNSLVLKHCKIVEQLDEASLNRSCDLKDKASFLRLRSFIFESTGKQGNEEGWLAAVPQALLSKCEEVFNDKEDSAKEELKQRALDQVLQYLGMLVAIDFRHWYDVDDKATSEEKLVAETVKKTGDSLTVQQFWAVVGAEETAVHTEANNSSTSSNNNSSSPQVVRGSAAMVHLCKRAVEKGTMWFEAPLALESDNPQLHQVFQGVEADGATPLMMPATAARIQLIREMVTTFAERDTSFAQLLRASHRRLYTPSKSKEGPAAAAGGAFGFIDQLVNLHDRYKDFGVVKVGKDGQQLQHEALVWFLKLAQLTVIAFQSAVDSLVRKYPNESVVLEMKEALTFEDAHLLTVASDYQLPRGLRAATVVNYDDHLSGLVDGKKHLEPMSQEEVEIRLASTVASVHLQNTLNNDGNREREGKKKGEGESSSSSSSSSISIGAMDYALWLYGRSLGSDYHQPHHLCKTSKY